MISLDSIGTDLHPITEISDSAGIYLLFLLQGRKKEKKNLGKKKNLVKKVAGVFRNRPVLLFLPRYWNFIFCVAAKWL